MAVSFIQNNLIAISGITDEYNFYSRAFKQFQVQEYLDIPQCKPDIEQIVGVNVSTEIISTNIIPVPCSISNEGQTLTGYKMVVEGKIIEKVEYVADNYNQSVHAAEFTEYFSNYIMLDPNISYSNPYKVSCYIEDVYIKQLNERQIFKNLMILLQAVPLNQPPLNFQCIDKERNIINFRCNKVEYFSQFDVEETIEVPKFNPDIEQIISTIIDPEIVSIKFIKTFEGISFEGQRLTGKKAVIELKFRQKVLYAAEESDQSIHGMENEFYTSAFIVVPKFIEGTDPSVLLKKGLIKANVIVEDVFVRQIDKRMLFKNLSILMNLDIIPTYEICYIEKKKCNEYNLYIMYENGKCKIPIYCHNVTRIFNPVWSPLGNEFAFIENFECDENIMVVNINNLKPYKLVYFNGFRHIYSFIFVESGRKIICSALKNCINDIYSIDLSNRTFSNLTNSEGCSRNLSPKYSEYSRKIVYVRSIENVRNLWQMNLDGSEKLQITKCGFVDDFDYEVHGQKIAYIVSKGNCNDKLYCRDISSLEDNILVDNPKIIKIVNVKYSPCGELIAFIGTTEICQNLYILQCDTGKIINLTKSHECGIHISDFTWNADSDKIYYACNYLGYYNIFSISLDGCRKVQVTNSTSNKIQLDYRPMIR